MALHPPEVRAAAISFVNSIEDGGVVIWTRSSATLCKLAMKLRKDSNIIVLFNKCATFKGISAACGGISPPSMDPLDCASMKVIAAFDKCFGDSSSYKLIVDLPVPSHHLHYGPMNIVQMQQKMNGKHSVACIQSLHQVQLLLGSAAMVAGYAKSSATRKETTAYYVVRVYVEGVLTTV